MSAQRGKPGRGTKSSARPPVSVTARSVSSTTVVAVLVVLGFAVAVFGYAVARNSQVSQFQASPENPDPSRQIPGIEIGDYPGSQHVRPGQRVAYDQSPPFGGPHDGYWAACNGVVYPRPVRTENMVHSLEHGAVWIAYDPARVSGAGLETLRERVEAQQYTMMSPYPGLDRPVSVQSWGHRLKLDDPNDPRLEQFIRSLRQNSTTHPEVGASCDALGPGAFDQDNPPPFDPTPPGPGAAPMQPASADPPRPDGAVGGAR